MAKQRKTREQKIAASQKHQHGQLQYSLSYIKPTTQTKQPTTHTQSTYTYVNIDVRKTFMVCLSFIAIEIVLFFLLQHQLVKIPGVSY